jgi:hypothetical protein
MLRRRLESQISFILDNNNDNNNDRYQEFYRILELVKVGEMVLFELSYKIESTRLLEEFIRIIEGAATSIGEIKDDIEQIIPIAESALQDIHDAITKISIGIVPELEQEAERAILTEVMTIIASKNEKEATAMTTNFVTNVEPKNEESSPA